MTPRLAISVLLLYAAPLCAQSIGAALSGTVADAQGLALEAAPVSATREDTGQEARTRTDSQGQWRLPSLPAGTYTVEVRASGFAPFRFESVPLTVGEARTLRAVLAPAAVSEQVTVSASAQALQQETSDRTGSYSQRLMSDLPMLAGGVGRNFRTQVYLTPGVAPSTSAHRPFAVNGARNRNNNYLIDSNDFNEIEGGLLMGRGASEQLLSTEAIDGMQVLTHNFKAEHGRQNGSVISIITKRGTNDWRGLAFEYLRNDALDARNALSPFKPPLRSHQFGFNLGGPLRKDRTFLFANSEWFPRRQTNAATVQTLTAAQRAQAVPAVAPLVALYPEPNLGANLHRASVATSGDQWSTVVRLDHALTNRQQAFWRTTRLDSTNRGVAGAAFQRYVTGVVPQGHSLQHVWAARANVVNEARLNYTRFTLNDGFTDPVALGNPAVNGLVGTVNVNGLSQLGQFAFMARQTAQNNHQASDDLSWTRGRHAWKMGFVVRRLHLNSGTFAPSFTGVLRFNSIPDFLSGRAASYSRNLGNPYLGLRATELGGYVQDDWKATPRLTLNLGLRYEFNSVPVEVNHLIGDRNRFRPDRNNLAPRVGFAYLLDRQGATVVRGGYGIYYNVLELSFVGLTRFNPPLIASYTASTPAFPDLLAAARQGIPSGIVLPDPGLRQPYAEHLNLTVERQLGNPQTTVSLGYVGTLGRKLPRTARPNGGDGLAQALRPDPALGVVNRLETAANSSYHSLQATANAGWRGLLLRGSYTWSKFLDEVSDFPTANTGIERGLLALDERNWTLNRGPSDLNLPHVATLAFAYDLPGRRSHWLLGGWSVQGIVTAQSGRPYTLYSGTDNRDGTNNNRIVALPGTLVRQGGEARQDVALAPGASRAQLTPAPGALGTLGRNTERGDRLQSLNASLFRSFPVSERLRLQFRAESFNVLNKVNYDLPDGLLTSPNFGAAVSALDPRQVQLALRLSF